MHIEVNRIRLNLKDRYRKTHLHVFLHVRFFSRFYDRHQQSHPILIFLRRTEEVKKEHNKVYRMFFIYDKTTIYVSSR